MDQFACRHVTIANGHIQRRQRQFGPQMIRHRPTNHTAAETIQHDREKDERFAHPYIGVSRPEEFHPRPLAEPDVNLSAHPAPIIQPTT